MGLYIYILQQLKLFMLTRFNIMKVIKLAIFVVR